MKKLMLTVAACAALAFGAKADMSVDELTKDLPEGWGYAIPDLGEKGDEVALVFTNTQNQTTWTAPMLLAKVEYLVVGGGGSGGASGNAYGGGGGGAGQVLNDTLLAVAEGTDFVIDVGAGGAGFGAQSKQGNDGVRSQFAMGGGPAVQGSAGCGWRQGGVEWFGWIRLCLWRRRWRRVHKPGQQVWWLRRGFKRRHGLWTVWRWWRRCRWRWSEQREGRWRNGCWRSWRSHDDLW